MPADSPPITPRPSEPDGGEPAVVQVFVDTNVLLHGRPLAELPFHEILGVSSASPIAVIVTEAAYAELDAQKFQNSNRGLRDRAERRAQELERRDSANDWSLPHGVTLRIGALATDLDMVAEGLDPRIADDVILAEMLSAMRRDPGGPLFLLSLDGAFRLRAKRRGLTAIALPAKYRLDVPDEHQKKIRELTLENERLKKRMPRFDLLFEDRSRILKVEVRRPRHLTPKGIEERCTQAAASCPEMPDTGLRAVPGLPGVVAVTIPNGVLGPSESDRAGFSRERGEWLESVREYYERDWHAEAELCARTLCLELILANSGSVPGSEVQVSLAFPEAILLSEERPAIKGRPPQPKRPRSLLASLAPDLAALSKGSSFERLLAPSGAPPNTRGPWFDKDEAGRPRVRFEVRKATQQCELRLPQFFALLPALDVASSFHAEVSILSEELPEWAESRLDVHVVVSADHTEAELDDRPFEA